ncbi:hypothetical protein K4F52_008773 [Lecanicillium sp. MT-2017a]|nr:hypothetical protein K4F52_008773 [Lecanicillium sp. MT-2017a]
MASGICWRWGPCPMMNTLANHGFLPRNGREITREVVVDAMGAALNFDDGLASLMFDQAIIANPEPNATYFSLNDLSRHNVLEHDASLSRMDDYFGNSHVFNQSVFDETTRYWTSSVLDANMLANSKLARQISSKAFNPEYTFTPTNEVFSLGELAAPIIAFGDLNAGTVPRDLVEYFFVNERFPETLGWTTRKEVVRVQDVLRLSNMIRDATNLLTDSQVSERGARRDLHDVVGGPPAQRVV